MYIRTCDIPGFKAANDDHRPTRALQTVRPYFHLFLLGTDVGKRIIYTFLTFSQWTYLKPNTTSSLSVIVIMASSKLRRRQGSLPKESPNLELSTDPNAGIKDHHVNSLTTAAHQKMPKHFHLDDIEMIKTIGTGTFARVFLCRQKEKKTINRNNNEYYALKILSMHDVIRLKQVDHVKNEKNILTDIQHPFIVEMFWFHKDKSLLYMLFPYICGGELFSYLRSAGRFNSSTSMFYAVEIVSALDYLHSLNIVYRDLKPENLLLDRDGHIKITDFGFAKKVTDRTWTLCGTPEYLAPEIIQVRIQTLEVQ